MKAKLVLIPMTIVTLNACALKERSFAPPPPPESINPDAVSVDSGSELGAQELLTVKSKAEAGDRDAALRLSAHFSSTGDTQEASRWQRIAAERGHPIAQYNMWVDGRGKNDCASMREALGWLEAAASKGVKFAREDLETYKKQVEDKCGIR